MLACLYDVHGNLPALEAALADARAQGASRFLLGGDYALFGGWPRETVERLQSIEDATWIRGNVDRWTSDPAGAPDDAGLQAAIADCRGALGDELADWLGTLDFAATLDGARAVHASPASDMRSFLPEPAEDEAELLEGVTEPRLLFGHTHLPFRRISAFGGTELVNPGSVGMPLDGDHRAKYALVHPDRRVEHRRVEYDWRESAARLDEAFGDAAWVPEIRGRLERAAAG